MRALHPTAPGDVKCSVSFEIKKCFQRHSGFSRTKQGADDLFRWLGQKDGPRPNDSGLINDSLPCVTIQSRIQMKTENDRKMQDARS